VAYEFSGIHNPADNGSYFVRIKTYASQDGTGSVIDFGGLAFSINSDVGVEATVPPYLLFCSGLAIPDLDCASASGDYINLGELSSTSPKVAQSQMLIATNADFGYSLSVNGTTMTSGTNVIPAISSPDVSRSGTSQFGINLVANNDQSIGEDPSGPGVGSPTANYAIPNRYVFQSGDTIATATDVEDYRRFTASYLVNISKNQAAGVYASTLTYVCLANF
jgi:hypothetical protein